jgi:hypothetical protein
MPDCISASSRSSVGPARSSRIVYCLARPSYGFPAFGSGVLRLPPRLRRGDGCGRKEVPIIVASITHDIWLGSTIALASIVGLLSIVVALSRRFREDEV